MNSLLQYLRYGARMLRKNPGFSLAAILTLALGIGANTAIFTFTSALLLRPLPYQDSRRLALLETQRRGDAATPGGFSLNRYELIRDHNQSFSGVAVFTNDSFNLTGRGEPQQVPVARVSANFFDLLGLKPRLGRWFLPDESQPAGKPVVVISNGLWQTRFGGDPNIVGQSLALDGAPYTIVGVLPAGVEFPFIGPVDVWSPRYFELTIMTPEHLRSGVGYLTPVTRLKPGASIKTASAEMDLLNQQYIQQFPKAPDSGSSMSVVIGDLQGLTVAGIRAGLLTLSAAVGLVLLIACGNVASLLLSRALARKKEIAVRAALGARRSDIVRQLLTESVLLAAIAGVLGLGLSYLATRLFSTLGQENLQGFAITMDARVFGFTAAASLLTGIIFGIFPALQLSRTNVNETLRDEGRGASASHSRVQLKGLLVVGQVALSLLLLIGAGLLLHSFTRLLQVDPGFDPGNLLTMNVSLPTVKYAKPELQTAFFDEMLRKVSALPGVRAAAISAALPLTPKRLSMVLPEGAPEVPLAQRPFSVIEAISPHWFQTMHVALKMGREFTEADSAQAPKVIIINETMARFLARRYWNNQNPVGKHLLIGRMTVPSEIVGVAADVKNSGLAAGAAPQLYLPFPQLPWGNMNLLVRTAVDPHSMISAVRGQINAVDPDQPVTNIQTASELLDGSRAQPRFTMLLLSGFSATALLLAIVGIYGVLAYSVAQRRQELGIRLALGAERADILRLVVGQGLKLSLAGIAIGLVLALVLSLVFSRMISGQLYKVSVRDLTTYALAPLVFLLVTLLASYLPARRAAKVEPTEAMR